MFGSAPIRSSKAGCQNCDLPFVHTARRSPEVFRKSCNILACKLVASCLSVQSAAREKAWFLDDESIAPRSCSI